MIHFPHGRPRSSMVILFLSDLILILNRGSFSYWRKTNGVDWIWIGVFLICHCSTKVINVF